jgi:hypothetical protein
MPTYALLGATGSTGSAILRHLIAHPPSSLHLNIFVRSKSKLLVLFPTFETSPPFPLTITEGTPSTTSPAATRAALLSADVILACIGSNYSTPGITLIADTARAIIAALQFHRETQGSKYKVPTIVQLRSASLNPALKAQVPWLGRHLVSFLFGHVYADLTVACGLFESSPEGLLQYIYVDPPAIHDPEGIAGPTGHKLLVEEGERQKPDISYADLGVAFCEIAERRGELRGRAVGVTATGEVRKTVGVLLGYAMVGLRGRVWG